MASQGNIQPAKLVLLGDMGAGKSSLVLRFVKGQFTDYQVRHDTASRLFAVNGVPLAPANLPLALGPKQTNKHRSLRSAPRS